MDKQISIIIPTYNMEGYIGKCLDSLLIPEFDKVEVWVVNDGSTDRSSAIARRYEARYPDSIHVIDKPNGNYGSCINAALPLCTGRYVKILDADDTFDTEAFSKFVNLLRYCDEEVIITNYATVNKQGVIVSVKTCGHEVPINVPLSIEDLYATVIKSYLQMHMITYKNNLFDKINYSQIEGISYSDAQWAIVPLMYCSNARCLDLTVYKYLIGREGQTMSNAQIAKSFRSFFSMLGCLVNHYNSFSGSSATYSKFKELIIVQHQYIYDLVLENLNEEGIYLLKTYDKSLKTKSKDIYDGIGHLEYSQELNYNKYANLRDRNYPLNFSIPLHVKLELSLRIRLKKLMSRTKNLFVRTEKP